MAVLEKSVENFLTRMVHAFGGLALKFEVQGFAGFPDRLVLLPGGRVVFVELKAPGKKPRPLQQYRHAQLRALGFDVRVIDSQEGVRQFVANLPP